LILFYLIQIIRQSGDRNKIGIMEKNRYLLTKMMAERAKQLFAGAKPLIKTKSKKPVAITLEEVKEGKIFLKEPNN
jgi:DNA-directed RNA polymerase omega subunit